MYDVLKDFASPVITLITALIAGFITFTFNRNQAQLARSQRDIALDKLKFDLFSLVCKSAERHVEVTVDHAKRFFACFRRTQCLTCAGRRSGTKRLAQKVATSSAQPLTNGFGNSGPAGLPGGRSRLEGTQTPLFTRTEAFGFRQRAEMIFSNPEKAPPHTTPEPPTTTQSCANPEFPAEHPQFSAVHFGDLLVRSRGQSGSRGFGIGLSAPAFLP